MKILIISPSFFPIVGGTEVAIHEISKRLVKKGHDVTILTPKYPEFKSSKTCEKIDSIRVYRFPISSCMYKFSALTRYTDIQLKSFRKIIELDRNENFDILHQFHLFALGGAVVLAKNILRKPLVTTLAGWDTYDPTRSVPRSFYPYLRWVMTESHIVTSPSSDLATHAKLQGFEGNIRLIPHGVDVEGIGEYLARAENVASARADCCGRNITLLSVHRLVPRKATSYLLDALKIVTDKCNNVQALIIGDGPERGRLVELAERLGIKDHVTFLGRKHDEIWIYYLLSDIFVLHTLHEGLGIVLLEAMACKKPVICTVAGATKEVIEQGKTGLLIPPRNPEALADAIMKLIKDEQLRIKMGMEGRKKVERVYDWNAIIEEYLELYRMYANGQRCVLR